jgi:hypothetical protein
MKFFQKLLQKYNIRKTESQDKWGDLTIGDILEFDGEHDGEQYVFYMIDNHGGPGMAGLTEPLFIRKKPSCLDKIFYIRDTRDTRFPEHIFGKDQEQTYFDGKTKVGWINSSSYRKVGHIDFKG